MRHPDSQQYKCHTTNYKCPFVYDESVSGGGPNGTVSIFNTRYGAALGDVGVPQVSTAHQLPPHMMLSIASKERFKVEVAKYLIGLTNNLGPKSITAFRFIEVKSAP